MSKPGSQTQSATIPTAAPGTAAVRRRPGRSRSRRRIRNLSRTSSARPRKVPVPAPKPDSAPCCCWCNGSGKEPNMGELEPVLKGHSQRELARAGGTSPAQISRLLSEKVDQQRKDPRLSTLRALRRGIYQLTGERVPIDLIAANVAPEE